MGNLQGFNQDTVQTILDRTREALEEKSEKGTYGHLNFYCNWCVHSELTQSSVCFDMLRKITDILLSKPNNDPHLPWFTDAVADTLDLKKLRLQLIDFYGRNSIPAEIFKNYEYWQHFAAYLREIISEKPIRFPADPSARKDRAKKLYDEIETIAAQNNGLGAKALWVTTETDMQQKWKCHWNIELFKPHITVMGIFPINEHPF